MARKTRLLTGGAFLTALSVFLLYTAAISPSGMLAIVAAAGLLTAVAVIEWGHRASLLCYIATAVLGVILLPTKLPVLLYILFFGYYPLVKSRLEHLPSKLAEWCFKLLAFNAAFTLSYLLYTHGFLTGLQLGRLAPYLLYGLSNAVFVVYDLGFSKLAYLYTLRIRKK